MAKIHRTGGSAQNGGARRAGTGKAAPGARKLVVGNTHKQRRRRRSSRVVVVVQLLASMLLVAQVWRTGLIPDAMTAGLSGLLLLFWIITLGTQRYRVRGAITRFFAWTLSAVMLVGCLFTQQGIAALQKVTAGGDDTVIGVYVMANDTAKRLEDTAGYAFGCVNALDRENTELAIEDMSAKTDAASQATDYASVFALADALYSGQAQAILLNQSFVAMVEDEEGGHSTFSEDTRCIYTYRIRNESLLSGVSGSEAKRIREEPFLVYLSGVDTRGDLTDTCRSDVNIIAAVNPVTKRIVLINTPRDYYVQLAGKDGAMDKLTHAGLYGVDSSMATLGALYGVEIPYYLKVNFAGFVGIIDALGGIDVVADQSFTTVGSPGYYDPVTITEGENHLDGASALAFARERHAFASGDIQRGVNQMKVIQAMLNKIKSPAVLRNYSKLMNGVSDSFVTNLSRDQIGALVKMQLSDGAEWSMESFSVTGANGSSTQCYSAYGSKLYVMQQDAAAVATAQAMLAELLSEEAPLDETASGEAAAAQSTP